MTPQPKAVTLAGLSPSVPLNISLERFTPKTQTLLTTRIRQRVCSDNRHARKEFTDRDRAQMGTLNDSAEGRGQDAGLVSRRWLLVQLLSANKPGPGLVQSAGLLPKGCRAAPVSRSWDTRDTARWSRHVGTGAVELLPGPHGTASWGNHVQEGTVPTAG